MLLEGLRWSFLGTLLVYLGLVVTRNTRLVYPRNTLNSVRECCEQQREVDISDSRLSNFGSDSGPHLDSSQSLNIDRVLPLTKTLNKVMGRICRKCALSLELEEKKILYLQNNNLALTFFEAHHHGEKNRTVYGKNVVVSRLDSIQPLGNAYISVNTDTVIVILQKIRFHILKYTFDFHDEDSKRLGSASFIYNKNTFLINISLSTNYDNSDCKVGGVDFKFIPDANSCTLKVEGIIGTKEFYSKLRSLLYDNFIRKVSKAIEQRVFPFLIKTIYQANICSYFDAKHMKNDDRRSFMRISSVNVHD